ncbi:phospholipase A-2-activating protein-like [Oscarella lobularis]|uniref:phospholipase A-2-activating protein-like n=1 Tax=Oscarella lobularis TaxID=121494 RepID=UPI0033140903
MLDGKAYDYVFNVELDLDTGPQTGRSYRLGYNITGKLVAQDPWFAAQQFLQKNELSPMHLDQVAQFIIENTKGVTVASASEGPSDPFTGGARYVPAGPSFTGGGAGAPRPLPSGPSDPFTAERDTFLPTSPPRASSRYTVDVFLLIRIFQRRLQSRLVPSIQRPSFANSSSSTKR